MALSDELEPAADDPAVGSEDLPDFRPLSPFKGAVAVGLLVAVSLYVVAMLVDKSYGAAIFATPFFIGVVTAVLCPQRPYRSGLITLVLALALGIVTLREGMICVLFSLPLLVPTLFIGSFVGRLLTRFVHSKKRRHRAVHGFLVLGLLWHFVEAAYDDPRRHPEHVAEAELFIAVPPERVFATLTQSELELRDDWPWFIRIGLPMPRRMSIHDPGPRAKLRFDIGQGTAFGAVTSWRENREFSYRIDRFQIEDLPFHITRLGRSPNYGFRPERVEDWLSVSSVRYALRPSDGAGTWLSRRIVWRRHLFPDLYFGWLQQTVMERGQGRLLALIAEKTMVPRARPQRTGDAVARASHLCTAVHTKAVAGPGSCVEDAGTVTAVDWAAAASEPPTIPWHSSNTSAR